MGAIDRRWVGPVVMAVLVRPWLWGTALGQLRRLAPNGWWRNRPHLPLPSREYLHFRLVTMYGGAGTGPPDPDDVVTYLRWCRGNLARR